jgi:hypothetical protein
MENRMQKTIVIYALALGFCATATAANECDKANNDFSRIACQLQLQERNAKVYSDSEMKQLVANGKQLRRDMTGDEVVSVMGRPLREHPLDSDTRVMAYPLGLQLSFYFNSRVQRWLLGGIYTNFTACDSNQSRHRPAVNCLPPQLMPTKG